MKIEKLFFVWSCSNAPTMNEMIGIMHNLCPEFSAMENPANNIGLTWADESISKWLTKNDIIKIAIVQFGSHYLDNHKYEITQKEINSFNNFNGEGTYLIIQQKTHLQ